MADTMLPMGLVLAFVAFTFIWRSARAYALLGRWAAESGYRILSRRLQFVSLLPFGGLFLGAPLRWCFFKGSLIFHIAVVDGQCNGRSGYVLCRPSGALMPVLPDVVEPRWDE